MSDELNPVPMQTGKKMHINMTENPRPFKTLIARRVPLRFEEEANKTIQDKIILGLPWARKIVDLSLIHI